VEEMGKLLPRLIGEDIELVIRTDEDLGTVRADASQMEQVIMNLAVNARDAMPNGGKLLIETVNAELDQSYMSSHPLMKAGPYVQLVVTDSGTGMDAETQAHIFEPFFTTKEKGKGTGLGLSTVYGIVEQCGGQVRVESELGKGTTFRIHFPSVDSPVLDKKREEVHPDSPGGGQTILLVEDQEEFRRMVATYLTRQGYDVLVARNGTEAIQISSSRAEDIHLMLSDVVMPGLRGPQLAKILAPSRPEMAILFMSGYTDGAMDNTEGVSDNYELIAKPFTWSALGKQIRDVLAARDAKRTLHVSLGLDDLAAR
jgi:two-component system, cell cycle sensor histidine kinase and response regulator CckA